MFKKLKEEKTYWYDKFWLHDALLAFIVRYYVSEDIRDEVREMIQKATGTNWNHDDDYLAFVSGVWIEDKIRRNMNQTGEMLWI